VRPKPTNREADYRCLSPVQRKTSKLEGEEEYTSIFRTLQARFPEFTELPTKLNLFPQIRVARTTIKLVARSICSRRFEYLAGKCYVASDWPKNSEKNNFFSLFLETIKKVENSEKSTLSLLRWNKRIF
jgi:hypothetical protein